MQPSFGSRRALRVAPALVLVACSSALPSQGGGETKPGAQQGTTPSDIALPEGYALEVVSTGLTFPTAVAFDDDGRVYVLEAGYSYGEVFTKPRVLRVEEDGRTTEIFAGGNPPWTGLAYRDGRFYVAEGGKTDGGRILEIREDGGEPRPIVEGLPSFGDHHTNGPAFGPDGRLYFGQGTATNSGVVGEDNAEFGWLGPHPDFHDVPCRDVVLAGTNFESKNPLTPDEDDRVSTGAYVPFGTATRPGQVVAGKIPCSGAVFAVDVAPSQNGSPPSLELVAWGFRNPYGLAFHPDGRLFVTDNGADERGSRPVWGTGDFLWDVQRGAWYGWPDYAGGRPLTDEQFGPPGGESPGRVLAEDPGPAPSPVAFFGVHSSSNGVDFSRSETFGHVGEAFVAQFGDMAPQVGKVLSPVGFKVVRVDTSRGVVADFAANAGGKNGPASFLKTGGLERPVSVKFSPDGAALYVVDFGIVTVGDRGPAPQLGTGRVFRIARRAS